MTRSITLLGYALVAVALLACEVVGRVWQRVPTLAQAVSLITRRPAGRWLVLGGWLWVGWHLFVRSHAGS